MLHTITMQLYNGNCLASHAMYIAHGPCVIVVHAASSLSTKYSMFPLLQIYVQMWVHANHTLQNLAFSGLWRGLEKCKSWPCKHGALCHWLALPTSTQLRVSSHSLCLMLVLCLCLYKGTCCQPAGERVIITAISFAVQVHIVTPPLIMWLYLWQYSNQCWSPNCSYSLYFCHNILFYMCILTSVQVPVVNISCDCIQNYKGLHPPLSWLLWHVLYEPQSPLKADHGFINRNFTVEGILSLRVDNQWY